MMEQAIALLETDSIAAGIQGGDAMVKTSAVDLLTARPICPGKYMILIRGEVSQVTNALRSGMEIVEHTIVDQLLLPRVHPAVFSALAMTAEPLEGEALGIIETVTAASCIVASDAAAKAAEVALLEIRLADGLGGKSYVLIQGMVGEVEAAVAAGVDKIRDEGLLVRKVVIPSLHQSMRETIS
ncbi:MAG: BMC domain-containing protein [Anaerolineae bacterium]|jgi:microcompartment protein CcmL/EutN|nr:BMC domain-containing protein [Anaerolineae bacterium]